MLSYRLTTPYLAAALVMVTACATRQPTEPDPVQPPHGACDVDARVIHHVAAAYPPSCAGRRIEGTVVAALTVDETGKVTRVLIVESSGDSFSEAATRAFEQWTFTPALVDCEPVQSTVRVTHRFAIGEPRPLQHPHRQGSAGDACSHM